MYLVFQDPKGRLGREYHFHGTQILDGGHIYRGGYYVGLLLEEAETSIEADQILQKWKIIAEVQTS